MVGSNSLLVDFMYTKLKKAIPKVWIKRIHEVNQNDDDDRGTIQHYDNDFYEIKTGDVIRLSTMKSKHFYSLMSERRKSDLAVLTHWEEICNLPIDFD